MSTQYADFNAQTLKGLRHLYHGELADRSARYTCIEGSYPDELSGYAFTTVFSYESVTQKEQINANPHMLSAPGRVLKINFQPLYAKDGTPYFEVSTHTIGNAAWHLRKLAPNAFVRSHFAEFSWFGTSDLSNTTATPIFPIPSHDGKQGVRLLLSYDAGRPGEVSPSDLNYLNPIGRNQDYHAAVGSSFKPMIMTTGHPAYDPEFAPEQPLLFFTHLVPRIASFFRTNQPITADLYLMTWDGTVSNPTTPMQVIFDGKPVILEQASAHQMCVTRNYVLIFNACLVLSAGSLIEPVIQIVFVWLCQIFQGRTPRLIKDIYEKLCTRLAAAIPSPHCQLYILSKEDIRQAIASSSKQVNVQRMIDIPWELTHAIADYDDSGNLITVFCQHNVGADPAQHMETADVLMDGTVVLEDLVGLFSGATDLNQVRKHVIDMNTGQLNTTAFPQPDDLENFPYGLNLLPPMQILPYRSRPTNYDLLSAVEHWDATYWVSGGWIPQIMSMRVFDIFRNQRCRQDYPSERLVPEAEYLQQIENSNNTVRFFRLDRNLCLESAYIFEPGYFMAAPIFVPRQDSMSVYDGWLVGQVWVPHQPHMEIWVWDASRPLHLGPICKLGPSPGERGLRPGFPLHSSWLDCDGVKHWQYPDYKVPIVEIPTYLKIFELANMASGFISRLVQQSFS
ncbi:carotenoid oxygenase family protein [Dendronalium sp. ChiSLP03b]|uniref:carotenoid oxygenase family protein n=1 Tax=Dendronalium sp. ChiSLP03b TaxID=3075381 RepID=UPI002AD1D5CD|nr:carotenoid oxygenase family protein [Dendronalium sp. ChiSLP03b]MDZ8204285.1 carotenoid oxygenase family protein [Dendronalium sp. ChiSLP03b]